MRECGMIKFVHELSAFPDLKVLVPRRIGQEIEIIPHEYRLWIPEKENQVTEDFRWIRSVATIALFRSDHLAKNKLEEPVKEFDPPIEFRIKYGDEELKQVEDIYQLKLAYWVPDRWVIISDIFHEYQIFERDFAPIAEVKIWSWIGDPTLAWGK